MSDFYWPGEDEPGLYLVVESGGGFCPIQWDGKSWIAADGSELSHDILKAYGYLGVRREAEPVNQAEVAEDNATAAREAKQELSMCRKPAEFERWAIKWGRTLCEIAGAS